jgi:hypothetical protein
MSEIRNSCGILLGKPERMRQLGTPKSRWEDDIKKDLLEIGLEVWSK